MARGPRDLDHLLLGQATARRPWRADRCRCRETRLRAPSLRGRSPASSSANRGSHQAARSRSSRRREGSGKATIPGARTAAREPLPRAENDRRRQCRRAARSRHIGATSPPTIFISVLLPAPLPPISATISEARTSRSMSCTARVVPKDFWMPLIARRRDGLPPSGEGSRARLRSAPRQDRSRAPSARTLS